MKHILIYDATFEGFLTCIFQVYEQHLNDISIQKNHHVQNSIFGLNQEVISSEKEASRVWQGLKKKLTPYGMNCIYYSFLSEVDHIEDLLLNYIQQVFQSHKKIEKNFSNPVVLKVAKLFKSVGREKHRMEAFVRFKLTKDGIYFANIEPDFHVLPLIAIHFKKRYADQRWVIYDIKRRMGISYDLDEVRFIELEFSQDFDFTKSSKDYFSEEELSFQQLWKDYFKSTNITSRKNMKLHIRHLPKRYWKYLSEKSL